MSYEAFAAVYDKLMGNVDYHGMALFIRDIILSEKPDAKLVLDMACGTGTLAVELDGMGFDMTAADASPDMLGAAMEKSPGSILYLCQRMEKIDMYGTMSAIVCTLDSINHVTEPDKVREIFRRAALFLDDDGVFIFDANTPYKHKEILADNIFVYDLDDVFCVWQNRTDDRLVTEIELEFFIKDDSQEHSGCYYRREESFCERAYSDAETEKMLSEAGLAVTARYDGYEKRQPGPETQRIVYVCKRTGAH